MTDIEQALAVEIDRHWLERTPEGGAICTCGGWSFTLDDRPIDVGERLLPFSEHVASATIASEPIRAIVRQAASGAAWERLKTLPDVVTWEVSSGYHDEVWASCDTHRKTYVAEKPTVQEAVAAIAAEIETEGVKVGQVLRPGHTYRLDLSLGEDDE